MTSEYNDKMSDNNDHLWYDINEPYDEEKYQNNYLPFLNRLTTTLTNRSLDGVGLLVPQKPQNERHLERLLYVHLSSYDHSIILALQRSNLYVRGYSRDSGDTYWAFSDSTTFISGSQSLGIDGNYDNLERLSTPRKFLAMGHSSLHDSIIDLATAEFPHRQPQTTASSLLILCQMIAEAVKFAPISNHISSHWHLSQPIPWDGVLNLQNSWATFSIARLNSGPELPPLADAPLLFSSYARPLVCIEYIKIEVNNISGENSGYFFGFAGVIDCWGENKVFEWSPASSKGKWPDGHITLTGPTRAISGADAFKIEFCFIYDQYNTVLVQEIAYGRIIWDPRFQDTCYDKTIETTIVGPYGNASVGYSVMTRALNATVKVVMVDDDPTNVYGTIEAVISLGGESLTTVSLFDKSSSEYVDVRPGNSIPLSRHVFPAPVDYPLTIKASLKDYDSSSSEDGIAEGSVQFVPASNGPLSASITGRYRQVEVSIAFE